MRSFLLAGMLLLLMTAMDLYAFRGLRYLFFPSSGGTLLFTLVYWGISLLLLTALLRNGFIFRHMRDPSRSFGLMVVIGCFLMLQLPKLLFNAFQLTGDLAVLVSRLFHGNVDSLRKLLLVAGSSVSLLLMLALGMGMVRGRTNLKVFSETLPVRGLPDGFNGLRIIQISDLHLAGFYHHPGHIAKVVEWVNGLRPDLILFTGDMVNDLSEEMDPFTGILNGLQAPLGKFAVLGNHDYGHYFRWGSELERERNLQRIKEQLRASGFDLLLNEHRTISRDGGSIDIIGVENWGKPPFPQYGDLDRAMEGTDPEHVKILMSHDPSHWDLQVRGKEQVHLTLSGHTHAMQFGIEAGRFRWSPSGWAYRHWAGLYRENGQYLYVNRGIGFIGYPGRVGIRPEIALLILQAD